jgi:hypothetical protein
VQAEHIDGNVYLILNQPHRYTATSYGLKAAFFYARLYLRISCLERV